jgi:hypothetical protein
VTSLIRIVFGVMQTPHLYVLSSGAQSALASNGVYFRQNYGEEYEIAVAVQSRLWFVAFHLSAAGSWTHVALTFSTSSSSSSSAASWTFTSTGCWSARIKLERVVCTRRAQFNQFDDIVVGAANDVQTTAATGVAVWNLVHADAEYGPADVAALVGEYSFRQGALDATECWLETDD